MNIKTFIVEDEPLARQTLRDFAGDFASLEIVGEAADGATALAELRRLKPALVFLDVQIPELDGIEILRSLDYRPLIVFTTAFDCYAITAFEFEAVDYLQKPFGRQRFRRTVERAERRLRGDNANTAPPAQIARAARETDSPKPPLERIFVRVGVKLVAVEIADVLSFVADNDYTSVRANGKAYLVNTTLNEFATRLPAAQFCRVHRNAIVNLKHVRVIEPADRRFVLRLSDNSEIVASRAGSQLLRSLIV